MYKTFARTHLDYSDVIFHEPHNTNMSLSAPMEELEKVQYKAALAVTGAWQGTSRIKLYEELGWESLSDRRLSHRTLMMHKILNNRTPSFLREKLSPPSGNPNADPPILREYRCRTDRFKKSFFPDATKSWNAIIPHFSTMPSFIALKSHLLSFFRPKGKSIFNIYDPTGTRHIFQLRVGLSPLRSHKYNHNFKDTPSSLWLCKTGIEDTYHFLFKCPFYASHRAVLAANVIGILIQKSLNHLGNTENLYLYGHHSLSVIDNKSIIMETIKFIKNNRFKTTTEA